MHARTAALRLCLAAALLLGPAASGGLGDLIVEDPTAGMGAAAMDGGGAAAPESGFGEEDVQKEAELMDRIEKRKAEIMSQSAETRTKMADVKQQRRSSSTRPARSANDVRDGLKRRKSGEEPAAETDIEALPLRERIEIRKAARKAEREAAQRAGSAGAGGRARALYRVDEGGAVAFRRSAALSDRSTVSAQPGDLIQAVEISPGLEDPGDWVRHTNDLWLPVRFLVPVEDAGQGAGDSDCVDKSPRCAEWAADGDCEKNLKYVLDTCPLSCDICSVRQAKRRPSGAGDTRRLEEEAAEAMRGVTGGAAAYPSAAPDATLSQEPSGPDEYLRLTVDPLFGTDTTTDVEIQFVLPEGFTLGVDGRACFDIFRAPLGIMEDTRQLYHNRKEETAYVESACFSKMQTLTASDTPQGSYRVRKPHELLAHLSCVLPRVTVHRCGPGGTLYSMAGQVLQRSEDRPGAPATLFRVVPDAYTAWVPSYEWAEVADWQRLPDGIEQQLLEDGRRRARIPEAWSLSLPIESGAGADEAGPGTLEIEVRRETTLGEVRLAAAALAAREAAARAKARRDATGVVPVLPVWAQCGAEGEIPIVLRRVGSEDPLADDALTVGNATWFESAEVPARFVASAEACVLDERIARLRDGGEEGDIVLEMVLQQFGLGACLGTEDQPPCHAAGWSVDDLREVLVAAVASEPAPAEEPPEQLDLAAEEPPPEAAVER